MTNKVSGFLCPKTGTVCVLEQSDTLLFSDDRTVPLLLEVGYDLQTR